jgi:hypothetical protein
MLIGLGITRSYTPLAESFQEEEVLPLLCLKPRGRVTVGMWERFMQAKPDIRRRVERQTPWRKSKIAAEMGNIYTTLSGRIHSSHQIGDAAVVIGTDVLTTEECLGVGALLYDFVPIEFYPPELMEKFERNEEEGTAEDVQDKAGKGEGERQ